MSMHWVFVRIFFSPVRRHFQGDKEERFKKARDCEVPSLAQRVVGLPERVTAALDRCCYRDLERRYHHAGELRQQLIAALKGAKSAELSRGLRRA